MFFAPHTRIYAEAIDKKWLIQPWLVWLSGPEHRPINQRVPIRFLVRVVGSVPGQGTYERHLIDASLSHRCFSPSLPLSLKSIRMSLGEGERENSESNRKIESYLNTYFMGEHLEDQGSKKKVSEPH